MRHLALLCTAASVAIIIPSTAQAQSGPAASRAARVGPAAMQKLAVVVPAAERQADIVQIAPVVAAPAIRDTVVVQSANPLTTIQGLPVERELSMSQIATTRALKLGSATVDLSAMLENRDALPNVAQRLQASPAAVTVKAVDVNAYVVPQGLIVRSFLNYQIKPGSCSDSSRRAQIEQAGISCSRKLSDSERIADYSDPSSPRFVADAGQREAVIAKARRDWAAQDAETASQLTNFRAILANPTERQKIEAALGAAETARLEQMNDDALAGELISSAETKVEDVMFIPKEDALDRSAMTLASGLKDRLDVGKITTSATNQPIDKVVFLTGFTLGRQYEWSKRIEKTIKWCWVGCAVTYYAGARAGFSYGFGLRFPIVVDGNYRYESNALGGRAYLTATMTPVDGTPAQYAAAGLDSSQIFKGQEFVAELKASAGYDYKLPLLGEDHRTLSVGYDLAEMLPAPYTHGQFTPPAPGTTSGEIPFVFTAVDLLMNYGNWGAAGVRVHPAVKVGLHSDALRFTVHDDVANSDQEIVNGKKVPLAIDAAKAESRFSLRSPIYNLGFIVTPGVNGHAWIDVGVWSDSWDFPVWFPQIAITLPPGGVDFACHSGTVCNRDYVYATGGSTRPTLDAATVGDLAVKADAPAIDKPGLEGAAQDLTTKAAVPGEVAPKADPLSDLRARLKAKSKVVVKPEPVPEPKSEDPPPPPQ